MPLYPCHRVDTFDSDDPDSHADDLHNLITKLTVFNAISTFLGAAGNIDELIIWTSSFWANSRLSWQDGGSEELMVFGTDDQLQ